MPSWRQELHIGTVVALSHVRFPGSRGVIRITQLDYQQKEVGGILGAPDGREFRVVFNPIRTRYAIVSQPGS